MTMKTLIDTRKNVPDSCLSFDARSDVGTVVESYVDGPNAGGLRVSLFFWRHGDYSCRWDTLTAPQVQEMLRALWGDA